MQANLDSFFRTVIIAESVLNVCQPDEFTLSAILTAILGNSIPANIFTSHLPRFECSNLHAKGVRFKYWLPMHKLFSNEPYQYSERCQNTNFSLRRRII